MEPLVGRLILLSARPASTLFALSSLLSAMVVMAMRFIAG
jgi:hypothetical protein